jgi:hypothetical protein
MKVWKQMTVQKVILFTYELPAKKIFSSIVARDYSGKVLKTVGGQLLR